MGSDGFEQLNRGPSEELNAIQDEAIEFIHDAVFGEQAKMQLLHFDKHIARLPLWSKQEGEKAKTKERLQNCSLEQLLAFCAYLNIQGVSSLGKADLVQKVFNFVEHLSVHQTRMEKYKENQEELKKKTKRGTPRKLSLMLEEHLSFYETRMEKYKENQEEELKKTKRAIEDPSYEDIRKAIWKALKIIGKPHETLIDCASIIIEKELDADSEEVKRALRDVLENWKKMKGPVVDGGEAEEENGRE